jgi:hypothetical protein
VDDSEALEDEAEARIRERVEKALALSRDFLTPEELEEHRRMLTFLARTNPAWLEDQRPRAVPDHSGTAQKPGTEALLAAVPRRSGFRSGGTG